ncbi:DUF4235 domain-containing protein [Cellulomonas composti]|uniref:DUF4235 domain-containing protein n=1 Tax=Cellulomonas composti TaxID=266130 RepID=A0A511J7Z1_9CELL|nr:DUF4235 domain-containing protein [Cellulomonas composti]GEL94115.1 hypothetical protein CCO02nite_07730 [Cellulomonas composti]
MPEKPSSPSVAMIAGLAAAALATWVATAVVKQSWQVVRGHEPPKADDPHGAALGEVVLAAALTGAAAAVARVLATRGTARFTAGRWEEPLIGGDSDD